MSRRECILVGIVFVAFALPMMYVKSNKWVEGYADTVQLAQITENIATSGEPLNQVGPGIYAYIRRGIPSLPPDQACRVDLTPPTEAALNHFKSVHTYFIIYLIAPLLAIVPVGILWPSLTVAAFTGLVLLAYIFLRRNGVSPIESTLFCLLVSFHPAWSQSLVYGQIYVDRLFLLLGSLFIYSFVEKNPKRLLVLTFAILSALLVERAGMVVAIFMVGYTVLYWKESDSIRKFSLLIGFLILAFSLILVQFYLVNPDYSTFMPANLNDLVSRFSLPGFTEKLTIFLLINFGMFGFALFNPRAFVLALIIMLPNIVGNIGGAEKTGWSTQYHSLYFPFLVWASASGFVWLSRRAHSPRFKVVLSAVTLCLIIAFGGINFYAFTDIKNYAFDNLIDHAWPRLITSLPDYWIEERRSQTNLVQDQLGKIIPENSIVSAPESAFPALYKRRILYLYPIGLEVADYAIPVGMITYIGEENRLLLEECLRERMKSNGYDMENPMWAGTVPVYKRGSLPP